MTTFRSLALAALLAVLLPALPASAHDPKPRHGGAIVLTATYHVEMVIKDGQVDVYLTGHDDKPVAVTGRKGVAILAGRREKRPHSAGSGRLRAADRKDRRSAAGRCQGRGPDHRTGRGNHPGPVQLTPRLPSRATG